MIRSVAFAALLFAAGDASVGARFAFVKPGETTQAEAVKRAGKPFIEYDTVIIDGELDAFVQVPGPRESRENYARAGSKKIAHVHVVEWDTEAGSTEKAKLVFRDGKLLYALLPVNASEASLEKLQSRYGHAPRNSTRERTRGDLTTRYAWHSYPEEGAAYFGEGDKIEHKAVFAAVKKE